MLAYQLVEKVGPAPRWPFCSESSLPKLGDTQARRRLRGAPTVSFRSDTTTRHGFSICRRGKAGSPSRVGRALARPLRGQRLAQVPPHWQPQEKDNPRRVPRLFRRRLSSRTEVRLGFFMVRFMETTSCCASCVPAERAFKAPTRSVPYMRIHESDPTAFLGSLGGVNMERSPEPGRREG